MFLRFSLKLIIAIGVMTLLATAGSVAVGTLVSSKVAVSVVRSSSPTLNRTGMRLRLFDLERGLSLKFPLPVEGADDTWFGFLGELLILSNEQEDAGGGYPTTLYIYDIRKRELHTLLATARDEKRQQQVFQYAPYWTETTLYDPNTTAVHVIDRETLESYVIVELGEPEHVLDDAWLSVPIFAWSPDGQQLAITQGENLTVVKADGSHVREFELALESGMDWFITWSQDSRKVLLRTFEAGTHPIRIIRVEDGSEHPMTVGLEGSDPALVSCSDYWLTYMNVLPNHHREAWLVNLGSGERRNLNAHPLLAGVDVSSVTLVYCPWIAITGNSDQRLGQAEAGPGPVYLANLDSEKIRLIHEEARFVGWDYATDSLIYETEGNTPGYRVRYRLALDAKSEPVQVAEYAHPSGQMYVVWYEPWSKGLVIDRTVSPGASRLGIWYGDSGEIKYLTDSNEQVIQIFPIWQTW